VRAVPEVDVSVSADCWTLGSADVLGTLELVGAKATPWKVSSPGAVAIEVAEVT
jgi:hypothetical protein